MARRPASDSAGPGTARRRARLAVVLALLGAALLLLAAPAPPAQASPDLPTAGPAGPTQASGCTEDDAYLPVLQVEGRLDAVLADFVTSEAAQVDGTCAVAMVLQLDSPGTSGDDVDIEELIATLEQTSTPVAVWVGQSGSRATGEAVALLAAADRVGLSPGSHVEVTEGLLDARGMEPEDLGTTAVGDHVGPDRAVELDLVDGDEPVLVDFVGSLPEVETRTVEVDGENRREPTTPAVFLKLPLSGQLMHTVASPAVAYLLFVIGLALLLFELYSAGVGIAGMVGAGCVVLGCYGLASLPTNPLGIALILLAMFGYAVDVQTGVPRVWTGIATGAFALGSVWIYDGMTVSWITLVASFAGMTLFMLRGMPVMVRSRFSTQTVDREWLVGESGTAVERLDPSGRIEVRGAPWDGRVEGGSGIEPGTSVRVQGVDGFVLSVEPAPATDPA